MNEEIRNFWNTRAFHKNEEPSPESQVLVDFVETLKPKKTLEVGCNWGRELKLLEGKTQLYGIDFNPLMISQARKFLKKAEFKVAEATEIPYPDNFFDLVYTDGLLSHVPPENVEKAISEIIRVSKKHCLLIEYLGTQ